MQLSPKKTLDQHKQDLCDQIDKVAGELRSRFVTAIPGQDSIYARKLEEAKAYMTTVPNPYAQYPYLQMEADLNKLTLRQMAERVLDKNESWLQLCLGIEQWRMATKKAIRDAETFVDAEKASAAPVPGIQ